MNKKIFFTLIFLGIFSFGAKTIFQENVDKAPMIISKEVNEQKHIENKKTTNDHKNLKKENEESTFLESEEDFLLNEIIQEETFSEYEEDSEEVLYEEQIEQVEEVEEAEVFLENYSYVEEDPFEFQENLDTALESNYDDENLIEESYEYESEEETFDQENEKGNLNVNPSGQENSSEGFVKKDSEEGFVLINQNYSIPKESIIIYTSPSYFVYQYDIYENSLDPERLNLVATYQYDATSKNVFYLNPITGVWE